MQVGRIPEIRESDAPPEVRAVYEDIKRATGIPQVNLIFRHLALEPELLHWAWTVIGPLYHRGGVAAAVEELEAGLSVPARIALSDVLRDSPGEAERLNAVIAFYNRGNASNLIGLTALLQFAEHGTTVRSGAGTPRTGRSPGSTPASIPPLPRHEEVPPDIMPLVDDLARLQGSAAFGVRPSLYLHLAVWPRAIRHAHSVLRPMIAAPDWQARTAATVARAAALAESLADDLGTSVPAPPAAVVRRYLETVRIFTGQIIPQMLIAGHVLSGPRPSSADDDARIDT